MKNILMVDHRQVETAAVPRHESRRVALDTAEKALQQVLLVGLRRAQRPDLELLAAAQQRRDGDDTMQVVAQKVGAGLLPAQLEYRARDVVVGQTVQVVEPPAAVDIGNGFDVEYEQIVDHSNTPVISEKPRPKGSGRRGRR